VEVEVEIKRRVDGIIIFIIKFDFLYITYCKNITFSK